MCALGLGEGKEEGVTSVRRGRVGSLCSQVNPNNSWVSYFTSLGVCFLALYTGEELAPHSELAGGGKIPQLVPRGAGF